MAPGDRVLIMNAAEDVVGRVAEVDSKNDLVLVELPDSRPVWCSRRSLVKV